MIQAVQRVRQVLKLQQVLVVLGGLGDQMVLSDQKVQHYREVQKGPEILGHQQVQVIR